MHKLEIAPENEVYDALIIGRGPAGIQAALHLARAGHKVVIVGDAPGSLALAEKIENYYGLPEPLSGAELQKIGERQARSFGVGICGCQVVGFNFLDDGAYKIIADNREFIAKSVLIATGARRSKAPVDGVGRYEGRGVSYCAVCDGFLYRGKNVGVLGYAQYALAEARELTPLIGGVTIFTNGNRPEFVIGPGGADPERYKVVTDPIEGLEGDDKLTGVRFKNGEARAIDALFVAYGAATGTDLAKKLGVLLNAQGYIITDGDQATNVPGVYAAGDCTGAFKQVAVAVGQGAIAARAMGGHIRSL